MARDRIFQFASLDKSPLITMDGEEIVDLMANPINIPNDTEKSISIIDKKLAGKPHLIARIVAGSQDMIDMLFSYNGYSNPLTVKGGDVIVSPASEVLSQGMRGAKSDNVSQKELTKRVAQTSVERMTFLKKEVEEVKTPNMNQDGVQFVKKGRSVYLGRTSTNSGNAVNETKDLLIAKIKQNDREF